MADNINTTKFRIDGMECATYAPADTGAAVRVAANAMRLLGWHGPGDKR